MEKQNIYQDISARTGGEIYLGVVGPVRSGKSTFIKRFMELLVLPEIKDENERKRTMDELPQSGTGKMVMTTEPKFIPKEAAELPMEDMKIKIRLIDILDPYLYHLSFHHHLHHLLFFENRSIHM